MTFKCRRRANTAMPMFLTSCETEMHMEIWIRIVSVLKVMACQNCQDFFLSYCTRYLPSLNYCSSKNITLERIS